MSGGRSGSYDRKLEDVLVARLEAGQAPEDLLAELKTRLGDAEADAALTRAERRVSRRRRAPGEVTTRILAGLAYAWTAVLALQNLIILGTVAGISPRYGMEAILPGLIFFPLLKIGLLCAGAFAFKTRRSVLTAILYAGAVLYAFPLGLFIDSRVSEFAAGGDAADLLSVSSLFSYAAALLIGIVYWQDREEAPPRVAANVFD